MTFLIGANHGRVRNYIRLDTIALHPVKDIHCFLNIHTLFTGRDTCVIGMGSSLDTVPFHLIKKRHRHLPITVLFTGRNTRAVGEIVLGNTVAVHLSHDVNGSPPIATLLEARDQGVVVNYLLAEMGIIQPLPHSHNGIKVAPMPYLGQNGRSGPTGFKAFTSGGVETSRLLQHTGYIGTTSAEARDDVIDVEPYTRVARIMRVRTCCCGSAVGAATTPRLILVAISSTSISMPVVAVATVRAIAIAATAAAVAIPTTPSSTSVMGTIPPPRQRSVVIIMTALIRQTRHTTLPHLDALSISSLEVVERLRRGIVGGVLGTRQRVVVAVIGPTVGGTSISAVTGSSSSSTTSSRTCSSTTSRGSSSTSSKRDDHEQQSPSSQ
mmetsp:Transcript_10280/g.20588  ORF Transcript_10280/g.20588 Transcript_10280/m.20588 type:complete len:381 (-) Transcript_10280:111-1253(-)